MNKLSRYMNVLEFESWIGYQFTPEATETVRELLVELFSIQINRICQIYNINQNENVAAFTASIEAINEQNTWVSKSVVPTICEIMDLVSTNSEKFEKDISFILDSMKNGKLNEYETDMTRKSAIVLELRYLQTHTYETIQRENNMLLTV
ncbi:hypothetical protein ABD91_21270 [Lysinibacillus sphaericus]|uniref:hypothetical protein n=1 Tax=Lysinibacillus sphaericus TaxID=1421 RepID=UPI0018CD6FF7|nr:hypothetical protein [Lysinibacillus sphaericus]MBG9693270.1 hypothetical protein [Lysinibacillus sphaericus]